MGLFRAKTDTGDNAEIYVQSGGKAIVEGKAYRLAEMSEVNIRVENAVLYKEPNADVIDRGTQISATCSVIDFNDVMLDAGCLTIKV